MAVIQQIQIAVENFCRKGVVEIKLPIMGASKARGNALTHRRVLRLFFQHGNLIDSGDIVHGEGMACYC